MSTLAGYVRRHYWGLFATVLALSGTAYASGALLLPADSVGTRQLKPGAVTLGKISPGARATLHSPQAPAPETRAVYQTHQVLGTRWGWRSYGHRFAPASYYRDAGGVVHLSGMVQSFGGGSDPAVKPDQCVSGGSTSGAPTIFVLPTGDRPAAAHAFAVVDGGGLYGRVDVRASGAVVCVSGAAESYLSLDGITFRSSG